MIHSINYLDSIKKGISYKSYRSLIDDLIAQNKTSGDNHSAFMVDYTKQNIQRMNHLDQNSYLNENLLESIKGLRSTYLFLVLTEAWCGDASQIVPVFQKIADASEGKIELSLIWRDENLDVMDQYLTNGGRSIPKLVIIEKETWVEKANWGPRPKIAQELYTSWKEQGLNMVQISEKLHNWYSEDKTTEIQREITELLKQL